MAAQDPLGNPKAFGYELNNNKLNLFIENRLSNVIRKEINMNYQLIFGFFNSQKENQPVSWYDAAEIYREWAEKQQWCEKRIIERDDIPTWFKKGPAIVDYPIFRDADSETLKQTAGFVKEYSDYLEMSVLHGAQSVGKNTERGLALIFSQATKIVNSKNQ